jgi:hypothetical protein
MTVEQQAPDGTTSEGAAKRGADGGPEGRSPPLKAHTRMVGPVSGADHYANLISLPI